MRSSPPSDGHARYWSPWLGVFAGAWVAVYWIVCAVHGIRPQDLLSQHFGLIFVGLLGAVLGNATAVGGGLVFVPYMMFFYDLSALDSLKLALATQAFGMTSGAIAWMTPGADDREAGRPAVPSGLILRLLPPLAAGVLLSTVGLQPSASLVKSVFGPVSIAIGALMLLLVLRRAPGRDEPPVLSAGLVMVTFAGTAITGWAAVGVGEVVAAWLMLRRDVLPARAIGLGVVLLAVASIVLAAIHWLALGGLPWHLAGFVILGAVFGARLGPHVARWISPNALKVLFALVAIFDGLLLVLRS